PDQAIFYTSGRTSNEAAFLYQLFVREYGTNNFPDCSNMCHEPSGSAMRAQVGVGKGTVSLQDFELADAIFVFGQNPGTTHPRMLGGLRAANRRGARIGSVNPMRERGLERFADPQNKFEMATMGASPISTHYFQLRGGGDVAAVKGMMKRLLERDDAGEQLLARDFIAAHTQGFAALAPALRAQEWGEMLEAPGLTLEQAPAPADVARRAKRDLLRGHGHHAADELGGDQPDADEPAADARQYRPARGRPVSGARPQQCAGRSHHGCLGEAAGRFPRQPAARFRLRPAAY